MAKEVCALDADHWSAFEYWSVLSRRDGMGRLGGMQSTHKLIEYTEMLDLELACLPQQAPGLSSLLSANLTACMQAGLAQTDCMCEGDS